jgi:ubiquinone/menaquinone biosynthesis C-methylase UbiE
MRMDLINSERNRTCLSEDMSARIRSILLKHVDKSADLAFHVTSDLNWLRYLKQVEFLERTIPLRSKVLDLGCGLGHTTALLASSCEDINIVGADIKKHSSWEELKRFGCEFCTCDATSLPFLPGSFDVIVSFGVMEHADSDIEFLKEVNRCLRNGGYNILFQLPNKYSLSECLSKELGLWHHERTYSSNDIKELIKICGFNIRCIYMEHVIPAQVNRVSRILANIFDMHHNKIYKLDTILSKTPLSVFSQDYTVISEKL